MSEQVNPMNGEENEKVEKNVEEIIDSAPTDEVIETVEAVEAAEIERTVQPTTRPAAQPTVVNPIVENIADDGDDFDDDDDADDDDFADDDDDVIREVDGPASYAPREKRGRFQRIGRDVKLEDIDYRKVAILTRFLDPRGRILSRRKTRVSAKIQRRAAREIKRARHLALLPYTADQTRITRKRGR